MDLEKYLSNSAVLALECSTAGTLVVTAGFPVFKTCWFGMRPRFDPQLCAGERA